MHYRIGEFAKLSGVSTKTLRFYDAAGLLHPTTVHPLTGYRRYSAQQLQDLAAILALKDLGASLREIHSVLCKSESTRKRRNLLEALQRRAKNSIRAAERTLRWLDAALAETNDFRAPIPVIVKRNAAVRVASVRAKLRNYEDVVSFESDLMKAVPAESIGSLRGVLWHRCADSGSLEGEPFIEMKGVMPYRSSFQTRELPDITAACAYSGSNDESAEEAYDAIRKWMSTRGFRLAGPKREIYVGSLLEIQFPLQPA
jgi:DNA-binding transcriptional MerR regulator